MTADAPGSRPIATPAQYPSQSAARSCLRTEPLEVGIDPLVQLLGIDSALVSAQVGAEKTGDHGCAVGT
jgi:hypothetical protein